MAQVKTKDEIRKVKMACNACDAIFTKICKIKDLKDWSEIDLKKFILSEIKKKGLRPSFPPIVSGGARAGNEIHPKPTKEKLAGFVILDFGARYDGYCSDMTRMLFVAEGPEGSRRSKPTKKDKEIYAQVLKSCELSTKMVKEGVKCADLDKKARKTLGKYQKYFVHMLGHGVGKRIHENPKIFFKLDEPVLKENMIITIEPGIYIKNKFGIRIEDTILVTKNGYKILTKSPKNLIIL